MDRPALALLIAWASSFVTEICFILRGRSLVALPPFWDLDFPHPMKECKAVRCWDGREMIILWHDQLATVKLDAKISDKNHLAGFGNCYCGLFALTVLVLPSFGRGNNRGDGIDRKDWCFVERGLMPPVVVGTIDVVRAS